MRFKKFLCLSTLTIFLSILSCGSRVNFNSIDSFEKSIIVNEDPVKSSSSDNDTNDYSDSSDDSFEKSIISNEDPVKSSSSDNDTNDYSDSSEPVYQNSSSTSKKTLDLNKNDLNYFFITDLHIDTESELSQCTALLTKAVEYANDNDFLDFVCIGGDLTTLYFDNKQEWKIWVQQIVSPLKKCNKPVLILNGNHDDNSNCSLNLLSGDCVIFEEWNEYVLDYVINVEIINDLNNRNSKYYYFDYTKNNKDYRIICLDSNNRPKSTNNKEYWGFSKQQIEWLDQEVLTDFNKEYVILSHMPIDRNLNVDHRKIEYNDELINLFVNKTNYKILINSFGHCHLNFLGINSIGLPCTCTSTLFYGGSGGYDGQSLYNELNTLDIGWEPIRKDKYGYSFNLFSISPIEIKRFTFGDGGDKDTSLSLVF